MGLLVHPRTVLAEAAALRKGPATAGSAAAVGAAVKGVGAAVKGAALAEGGEAAGLAARLLWNVRHGRFERTLSLLTAAGSMVTAAEIYLEHDRASFGNKMMWWPVVLGPLGAAAGVAGFRSDRAARTVLPLASAAIVANGLQGTYLHVRGIAQKPGGWSMARYNVELGPPLFAPLLVTMVGGMGLVASVLRRER
ncbi:hypothetical protein KGA66_09835 [Actinocrinis puniceicyclus]|uniref:Uncharacterized protein n=1 Tax=Actinocrinis puniceicyclus TaxID=977794 RepID=A0A8J7WPU5_9ACTN|nr:hypothetical protein [Actinocrinis puniceicyclus]MBS2963345.1 hypothetical protein [Actinocrinis puniceicyclus]